MQTATLREIQGTSLRGYVTCSYHDLCDALGEPEHFGADWGDGKVTIQWRVKDGPVVATVYDWKGSVNGADLDSPVEWNIGGNSRFSLVLIAEAGPFETRSAR